MAYQYEHGIQQMFAVGLICFMCVKCCKLTTNNPLRGSDKFVKYKDQCIVIRQPPWSLPTITEWSSAVWGFKTGMRKGFDSAVRVNNTSRLGNLHWAVLTDLLCSWWFWRLPWVVELGAMEGWAAVLGFFLSASGGNLWIQVQVRLVDCLQRLAGWHLPVLPWVLKVSWLEGRWVRLMNMKLIMIGQGTMPGTFRKTEHMAHS